MDYITRTKKKYFEDIGWVEFKRLEESRTQEAIDLIYFVYQHEKIWVDYTKEQINEELMASFVNICYRPIFLCAYLNNKMIGIASLMESHISSQGFELSFNTILPEYQRKGLGYWLTYIRLEEIVNNDKNAVIFVRARRPKLFEKFSFKYIYQTNDADGCDTYDYLFCPAKEIIFNGFEKTKEGGKNNY